MQNLNHLRDQKEWVSPVSPVSVTELSEDQASWAKQRNLVEYRTPAIHSNIKNVQKPHPSLTHPCLLWISHITRYTHWYPLHVTITYNSDSPQNSFESLRMHLSVSSPRGERCYSFCLCLCLCCLQLFLCKFLATSRLDRKSRGVNLPDSAGEWYSQCRTGNVRIS